MVSINNKISQKVVLFAILISIGVALRFLIAGCGFTYDLQSYEIVAKIVQTGGNVYRETTRYNYGPNWFLIVGFLYKIAQFTNQPFLFFRFLVVGLLTVVDICIALVLYRKFSYLSSLFFFLNPISIILTGFYSQFDNLAVLLGLLSVLRFEKAGEALFDRKRIEGILFLSLSLITKHVFFAFPLWLAVSEKGWKKKLLILFVPIILFGLSFLPFLKDGFDGIKQNVFFYSSFHNAPLWQFLIPDILKRIIRKEFLFFGMLIVAAIFFRNKKPLDKLLLYTAVLVTFSYSIADQYIAIILPFISVFFNIFSILFTVVQTLFLGMIVAGGEVYVPILELPFDRSSFGYTTQILLLFCVLLSVLYRHYYPKSSIRHLIVALAGTTFLIYGGIIIPSYIEDQKMIPIENAIQKGDYEKANSLYHDIEVNPPFAGSRFYEKLGIIRFNINFYRTYRYALDGYIDHSLPRDWKKIKKNLEVVPEFFPDKKMVKIILDYAGQL